MPIEQQQLELVAKSAAALHRASKYERRLSDHLAILHDKMEAVTVSEVAAAIGARPASDVDLAALRSEAEAVSKQHGLAVAAVAALQAEHVRHEMDLGALFDDEAVAYEKLQQAHEQHRIAIAAADRAKAVLGRAKSHQAELETRLSKLRGVEADKQRVAVARLHEALRDGSEVATADPTNRANLAVEEDIRVATAMVGQLQRDVDLAAAQVSDASLAVDEAASMVMRAEAETVAKELLAVRERAADLHDRLKAYVDQTSRIMPTDHRQSVAVPIAPGSQLLHRLAKPATFAMPATMPPVIAEALAERLNRREARLAPPIDNSVAPRSPAVPVAPGSPLYRPTLLTAPPIPVSPQTAHWLSRKAALIANVKPQPAVAPFRDQAA